MPVFSSATDFLNSNVCVSMLRRFLCYGNSKNYFNKIKAINLSKITGFCLFLLRVSALFYLPVVHPSHVHFSGSQLISKEVLIIFQALKVGGSCIHILL